MDGVEQREKKVPQETPVETSKSDSVTCPEAEEHKEAEKVKGMNVPRTQRCLCSSVTTFEYNEHLSSNMIGQCGSIHCRLN